MKRTVASALALFLLLAATAYPQQVRVRDLTSAAGETTVRLMGYGLVVGLDGTGDRAVGARGARHTVQSVTNLLRRFDIEVPADMLRTRNVAAVLVVAELSPYLRAGGRFEVHVSSLGDATSLRGGLLWMTPLVAGPDGPPLATAQGPLILGRDNAGATRQSFAVETTARIPDGGLLQAEQARPEFSATDRLMLREPNLGTAIRISEAIVAEFGAGTASVQDPGMVALELPADMDLATSLARIGELTIAPDQSPRLLIDGRDGTVVAGGSLLVGEAVVSHGNITLAIGGTPPDEVGSDDVWMRPGTPVQDVAVALRAVGAPPATVAAVFESLHRVGALPAQVVVR